MMSIHARWKSIIELDPQSYEGSFAVRDDIGTTYIFAPRNNKGERAFYFRFEGKVCRSTGETGPLRVGERIVEIYNGTPVRATVNVKEILVPNIAQEAVSL